MTETPTADAKTCNRDLTKNKPKLVLIKPGSNFGDLKLYLFVMKALEITKREKYDHLVLNILGKSHRIRFWIFFFDVIRQTFSNKADAEGVWVLKYKHNPRIILNLETLLRVAYLGN